MNPGPCDPKPPAGLHPWLVSQSLGVSASPSAEWAGGAPCGPVGGAQTPSAPVRSGGGPEPPLGSSLRAGHPALPPTPHSRPRRRSVSVGTRERQQRLCAQVTEPLSLLNGWVAKTARSNRVASPSARGPAPPPDALARQPHPQTYSGDLSQRCPSPCPLPAPESPRSPRGTQVFLGWGN